MYPAQVLPTSNPSNISRLYFIYIYKIQIIKVYNVDRINKPCPNSDVIRYVNGAHQLNNLELDQRGLTLYHYSSIYLSMDLSIYLI